MKYGYDLGIAIADDLVKIDQEWYVVVADPDDTSKTGNWDGNYILRRVGLVPTGNGGFTIGMPCGKSSVKIISAEEASSIELDAYADMCCNLPGSPTLTHYTRFSDHFRDDMMFKAGGRKVIL